MSRAQTAFSERSKLLIANRGEIAIRIATAANALGIETVGVFSEDDARCLHTRHCDTVVPLQGVGARAYLDADQLLEIAHNRGCTAVHPGYGFLAESPEFARRVEADDLTFVGPDPSTLALLGDKASARSLAADLGIPVLVGTEALAGAPDALRFFEAASASGAAIVIKAVAGGGGRGMRVVRTADAILTTFERCQAEARAAFGDGRLYAEHLIESARHVEVQIAGDSRGGVSHLYDRECSVQRQHQKLIEIAPASHVPEALRNQLFSHAVSLARETAYRGLGTFEFLVERLADGALRAVFIEANPRIQVEHTVTEQVLGVDLVQVQLAIARGATLEDLGLAQPSVPAPRGFAVQARVNMETLAPDGTARPTGGTLTEFEVPTGPGVRVDTLGYRGYATNPNFDSLLAKVIVHGLGTLDEALSRARHALVHFRVEGVATNLALLHATLSRPELKDGRFTTRFVELHTAELTGATLPRPSPFEAELTPGLAGARVDAVDPLAVLAHGRDGSRAAAPIAARGSVELPHDHVAVSAPLQGSVIEIIAGEDDAVLTGAPLLVMEAMKMQHVIASPTAGRVVSLRVARGDTVYEGHLLVVLHATDGIGQSAAPAPRVDVALVRADLAEVFERHGYGLDENRPLAVAKRRKTGHRTTRENVAALVDDGTFREYGPLVIAAQRGRRTLDDLMQNTPGDGMVAGVGRVNGAEFPDGRTECVVVAYDYTVLAGTQGHMNHRKKDRMFEVAREARLPVVVFAEGGGGRPGDTDHATVAGLDCMAWVLFGKLSGLVPLVGITTGRCFAGNAVLLGQCDVVIATRGSNIGLGGPAMIEGGGLGVYRPEDVGPLDVQTKNGVVDIAVEDEAEAVATAKRYLAYFQGSRSTFECADQRELRHVIPENRLRVYDVRRVVELLVDTGSMLELRREFALGMVTALARIEGRTVAVIANNPVFLAGAIDSDGADKAARFMQLCDAFDIPLLFLCDTPGIMVGPEAEKTATARHATRLFNTAANLTVPFFTIVLRKGYGLGAMAMAGGSFKAPAFMIGWPTAEFGGMGLEGAVKLGARKALEAIEDPEQRRQTFDTLVAHLYDQGRSVNAATFFEFDDIIDPADSRKWITGALRTAPRPFTRTEKKRPYVDTW